MENVNPTEAVPSLIRYISDNEVVGFDSLEDHNPLDDRTAVSAVLASGGAGAGVGTSRMGIEAANADSQKMGYLSISMPPSPLGTPSKKVFFSDSHEEIFGNGVRRSATLAYSQPMPKLPAILDGSLGKSPSHPAETPMKNPSIHRLRDKRFDSFKTWSGKLERQISNVRGRRQEDLEEQNSNPPPKTLQGESLHVDRYFDALQGPELDTLRPSEEILLPEDKQWPFLLRFPISSFGICLGVSSQAIMWKALATSPSTKFLNISLDVNLILWWIAVVLVVLVFIVYILKLILYFEAVRREYYHPIRVNFFFAPWISLLFLVLGVPPSVSKHQHASLWYVLMTPIFILELKIYGQWMSGGQRRLSKVANPSNHLSVVGNFVGALLGASMGLKEGPIFFFAVGMAHYTVLFVTLYQRLPTNETLPKELHPVFFLFVAAPSVASMAWAKIQGSFDYGSRISYFIAMFLYLSLAVRINFFRGFTFSLAWWAYTFPMTGAAIATIRYSAIVTNVVSKSITVILCSISTLTVTGLLVTTIIHAFVLRDLFPNDIAIAISDRKMRTSNHHHHRWFHRRNPSSDTSKDAENYLKFANSAEEKDLEASTSPPGFSSDEGSKSAMKQAESSD